MSKYLLLHPPHWVSEQYTIGNFPKIGGHFEFLPKMQKHNFIALIHPIQWTIAYPVGADRPAKCQKKTSCVSTGRSVRSTSALARWRVVLPCCVDSMTS